MAAHKDPMRGAAREARAQRRVGEGAACVCGEKRPAALISGRKPIVCYECDAKQRGMATFEEHHVAGRANDPTTLQVPINDHRAELSTDQYDWPPNTLQNPEGSPLLRSAARIRGFIDTVVYLIKTLLGPIAEELEESDTQLRERHGPQWWVHMPDHEDPR